MPSALKLEWIEQGQNTRLRLVGQLTGSDLAVVADALRQAEANNPRRIELELNELEHIDSAGLGFLTSQYKHFLDLGCELWLHHVQPRVLRVLHLTNLDKVLLLGPAAADPASQVQQQRQALWESFHYTQMVLAALGDGLLGLDLEGCIAFANPAVESLLGWNEKDLYRRPFAELIAAPSDPEPWRPEELFSQPHRQAWVLLKRADGSLLEAVVIAARVQHGGEAVGMLLGMSDRLELEHTRQALRATQRQLALIAASTSDALMMYDLQGQVLFINNAAHQMTGFDREQLRRLHWSDLAPAEWQDRWESLWIGALGGRSIQDRMMLLRTAVGRDLWVSVNVVPVVDEQAQRIGMLFSLRDVDERRRLAERVQFLERMESVGRLAVGMASDFRQVIERQQAQFVQAERLLIPGPSARLLLAELRQQNEYVGGLVQQLLTCGTRCSEPAQPVSLPVAVGIVLATLRPRLIKGIEVSTSWGQDATEVMINPDDMQRVLLALCINALEAMETMGGHLRFSSERTQLADPENSNAASRPSGSFIQLTLSDNGPGMAPEVRERAFEPFFTTKPAGLAQGLGLSLVYGLVRQAGGWVRLESAPGEGTRVELFLPPVGVESGPEPPVCPVPALIEDQGAELPGQAQRVEGGERLLVIDDESLVLNFAASYLEHLGYRAVKALTATHALTIFGAEHDSIDIVLLDLSLPDMPGLDLLRRLEEIDPGVRVIVSSGLELSGIDELRDHATVRGILQKPYRGEQLARTIREALAKP